MLFEFGGVHARERGAQGHAFGGDGVVSAFQVFHGPGLGLRSGSVDSHCVFRGFGFWLRPELVSVDDDHPAQIKFYCQIHQIVRLLLAPVAVLEMGVVLLGGVSWPIDLDVPLCSPGVFNVGSGSIIRVHFRSSIGIGGRDGETCDIGRCIPFPLPMAQYKSVLPSRIHEGRLLPGEGVSVMISGAQM